jgi:integrase
MARGSVVKRGKHYSIVYYVGTKQRWKSVGRVTRQRAEKILRETMGQLDTGTYLDPPKITFEAFAMRWLEQDVRPKKWSTYLSYKSKVHRLFVPTLGELPLDRIGVEQLDRLRAEWLATGRAPTSVRTACTVLKRLFKMAVKWKYIARNPAADLEKPTLGRCPLTLLEPEQLNQLLDALQAPECDPDGYVVVLLLLFTGLRIGELIALEWDDVDLGRRQLHVRRIWSANRITTPKTTSSLRVVDLPPRLVDLLRARQLTATDRRLFPGKRGGYFKPKDFVKQTLDPVLRRVGLPRLHLHALRHHYASLLIAQAVDAKYICESMGHSSIRITFDVYGHLFARTRQQASACLEQALQGTAGAGARRSAISSGLAVTPVSPVTAEERRPLPVRP